MSADRDMTRIVRSWLRTDEHESADRVLDNVFDALDATPQRRSWWPAWRIAPMNSYVKLAIAAAAVVVVALVGLRFLPGTTGPGGATASPSASPSPTPTLRGPLPASGALAVGTYTVALEGNPVSFTLSTSGWGAEIGSIGKGVFGQPASAGINIWESAPDNVYSDPCAHTPLDPPATASAQGLAAAVVTMPGIDVVTQPTGVTVDGRSGKYVAFTIREDIACDPHKFYLWYDDNTGGPSGGWRWASALGALHRVWMFDVNGKVVWLDSETFKGAKPELNQEIQQIIESIKFG